MMAFMLGGKHRWNEMLFHDVHHAFPNAVGTLSQRGRFHGWQKVHDAAVEVLHRGLWKPNGDEETEMQKMTAKRSMIMKSNRGKKINSETVVQALRFAVCCTASVQSRG